jgi:hypothetical protein
MTQSAFVKDPKSLVRRAALAIFRLLLGNDGVPVRYRPEAHYMRGPGPKWREKHGSDQSVVS